MISNCTSTGNEAYFSIICNVKKNLQILREKNSECFFICILLNVFANKGQAMVFMCLCVCLLDTLDHWVPFGYL